MKQTLSVVCLFPFATKLNLIGDSYAKQTEDPVWTRWHLMHLTQPQHHILGGPGTLMDEVSRCGENGRQTCAAVQPTRSIFAFTSSSCATDGTICTGVVPVIQ